MANIPASVTTLRRSAPLNPSDNLVPVSPQQVSLVWDPYLYNSLVINLTSLVDRGSVDLQDLKPCLFVREWDLDLSVQSTRSEEGWIKGIRSICGHYEFSFSQSVETVHLIQQLCAGEWLVKGGT